jgi:hypothetical protein
MANISSKELTALDEQLNHEQTLVKKFTAYANNTSDTNLRTKYQQLATKHQSHFNTLLSYLN